MQFADGNLPDAATHRSQRHQELVPSAYGRSITETVSHNPNIKIIPGFRHKPAKESLWMEGPYDPILVKDDMLKLQKTEEPFAIMGMHKAQEVKKKKKSINSSISSGWKLLSVEEALPSLEQGMMPSNEDFTSILHSCRKEKNLAYARFLHAYMRETGLVAHTSLGNQLVTMLVDVGSMCDAQRVFDRLVIRDECSWNALITGYVKCGESQHALILYQKMQEDDSLHPNGFTYVALLRACAKLKDLETGCRIHAEIATKGSLEKDLFVGSSLVSMYAKCGSLTKALEVFDKLLIRDVVLWTALISGYADHGHGEEALTCFEQMQHEGVSPNAVTFVCSLKACGSIGAICKGRELHGEVATKGLEKDLLVGSTLVDMYSKCGSLAEAQEVFDKLPMRDVVSWNALILGYAEHGHGEDALACFKQMQHEGVSPNAVTFVCSLKACSSLGVTDKGQELHAEISRKGLDRDLVVGSTLVDMYAKCGLLPKAQEVFDNLLVRDVVSWNALIAGYAEHGRGEEALKWFEQMQCEGFTPDIITFICSLKACGSLGATDRGKKLHAEISRKGMEGDLLVGSLLVDMYAKCGALAEAQEVFDKLPVRDIVSWTALIAGYAQLGHSENVFHIFDRMIGEGIKPNPVTFVSVLNACSHAGLVDKAQAFFKAMSDYGIIPTFEHHTCLVDLFGRAGQLDKAVTMIKKMPFHPDLVLWHTVLGACRNWGNVEVARHAFGHALQLNEKDAACYVNMSNIFADADTQEDFNKV